MLTFILGIIAGAILVPITKSIFNVHSHDYEVLFHRPTKDYGIRFRYYAKEGEPVGTVYATYKKCKKCGEVKLTLSNGTDQTLFFDEEYIIDKIKVIMKKEQEAESKRLLESMEDRMSSKNVDIKEALEGLRDYNKVSA